MAMPYDRRIATRYCPRSNRVYYYSVLDRRLYWTERQEVSEHQAEKILLILLSIMVMVIMAHILLGYVELFEDGSARLFGRWSVCIIQAWGCSDTLQPIVEGALL